MRLITDLSAVHKGEPIWVVGSGPSLDEYPDDFLNNEVAIALHLAYLKYPLTDYRLANEYDRVRWFKENRPEYLEKSNLFAFPFYNKTERETSALIDLEKMNYFFYLLRPYPKPEELEEMVWEASRGERFSFGGYGSCAHAGIFCAIIMGGRPINLIGCNHEPKGNLEHFKLGNDNNQYRANSQPYAEKGKVMKKGTELLIKICAEQGIIINWFKSYEQARNSN